MEPDQAAGAAVRPDHEAGAGEVQQSAGTRGTHFEGSATETLGNLPASLDGHGEKEKRD
ncbi:MAG: hypothetical protein ABSF22_02870 [Bryobacteraceae bacterium]